MKNAAIFLQQTALKSLGFDPGPIDGSEGPLTRAAMANWLASLVTRRVSEPDLSVQLDRWEAAVIAPGRVTEVDAVGRRILRDRKRYESVAKAAGVPWYVIACLHNMEASGDFTRHLHEGSALSTRTKYVPKGRPVRGNPPFTWEESALDALEYDQLAKVDWDSLAALLYACERYNGLGYLKYHRAVPSPYLWAATSVELPGKYVADGSWSETARSQQVGVAAILKYLVAGGHVVLPE